MRRRGFKQPGEASLAMGAVWGCCPCVVSDAGEPESPVPRVGGTPEVPGGGTPEVPGGGTPEVPGAPEAPRPSAMAASGWVAVRSAG